MAQIDSLIRQALAENNLTIHKYYEFAVHAFRALKELRMDTLKDTTKVELTVDENNSVIKPTDFIDWVRISRNRLGFLVDLEERKSYMPQTAPEETDNSSSFTTYYHNGRVINLLGEHMGKQYGTIGDNTRDIFVEEDNRIRLGSRFSEGSKVVLEYLHLTSPTVSSLVHAYAEASIVAYITYCYVKQNPRKRLADVQYAKRQYQIEMKKLRARFNGLTARKISMIVRRGQSQAPDL